MIFDIEVKISLKDGMLNPEAKTIENSLSLLGYNVNNTKTLNIITFDMEGEDRETIRSEVDDMCQKLLCNPVIHNYKITIIPRNSACGDC
ncbi:phosphoribosylformylglycinamidine synthase, purS protein [Methanobrevibacter sp. 87.7]|uniref:phosphoribosylformylglycinamidine synthase subunit PurS n=1 Tax=Methanobrevibacter sp. 87.7 TaxID=387957 RepID=UPI000B4FEDCF|nr:phosphoribosylformylglycinamidine synthase subunit PurS [Methanobrevibacter sp. 87.7]OWT33176.1 phosphoribosylformylglycinamidine synthase, purS protein [Methanobrevibacter sp. 87.7]